MLEFLFVSIINFHKVVLFKFLPNYQTIITPLDEEMFYVSPSSLRSKETVMNYSFFIKILEDNSNESFCILVITATILTITIMLIFGISLYFIVFKCKLEKKHFFKIYCIFILVFIFVWFSNLTFLFFFIKNTYVGVDITQTLELLNENIFLEKISNLDQFKSFLNSADGSKIKQALFFYDLCKFLYLNPKENLPIQYQSILQYESIINFYHSLI